MNSYVRGTPINLVQQFWSIDPITKVRTPANPTTVAFTVRDPDGGDETFTFGASGNVTNPATGVFVCALDPQLPTGIYSYLCAATGVVEASFEDSFAVTASAVLAPDDPQVAVLGPFQPWINGSDVLGYAPDIVDSEDQVYLLEDDAVIASALCYELSGRQFPGVGVQTVRPCRQSCGCFSALGSLEMWYWTTSWFGGSGAWRNESGAQCGCGTESYIRLNGYPVNEITQVKQDGVVIPEFDLLGGWRNWRLDRRRNLIRMADPGPPVRENAWPACQNLDLPDTAPGTFSVTYSWGQMPPIAGTRAAAQLAAELYKSHTGGKCRLPNRVTRVARAGVTMDRILPTAELFRQGASGLESFDLFIAAYNPMGMIRRPAIYSPDQPMFAERVGQD